MKMPQLHTRPQLIGALAPSVRINRHQLDKYSAFSYFIFSGTVHIVNYTLVVLARTNYFAAIREILKTGQSGTHKSEGTKLWPGGVKGIQRSCAMTRGDLLNSKQAVAADF